MSPSKRGSISRVLVASAGLALAASAGYGLHAYAEGAPTQKPVFYAGALEANGRLASGAHTIVLTLFDAETAGEEVCVSETVNAPVEAGRFRVEVSSDCVAKMKAQADLWVALKFSGPDGVPHEIPLRTKIGAVPYAMEAQHAVSASSASKAEQAAVSAAASGALASTLAALEMRIGLLEAFRTQQESDAKTANYLRIGDKQIAWGIADVPANSEYVNITFPKPFLDGNYALSALPRGAGVTRGAAMVGVHSPGDAVLQWIAVDGYAGNGQDLDWIAVGRWK